MYETYYGLRERPFDLTPNPRYLFLTRGHREALTHLQYGLRDTSGITVVTGEAGTGKTTLIQTALASRVGTDLRCVYVNNPTLTRGEFLEMIAMSLHLSVQATCSKTRLLLELRELLTGGGGVAAALIVDEAQSLPDELLEEVRLLANVETPTRKLLPVVLVGQPELAARLNQPSLRQLKQRVALRCVLNPMTSRETPAYISRRIRIAGGDVASCFTEEAMAAVHEMSGGIPRTVCVICDNALITGFAAEEKPVGRATVLEVCRDFDLAPPPMPQAPDRWAAERHWTPPETAPAPAPAAAAVAVAERPAEAGVSDTVPAVTGGELFSHFARPRRFLFF
jgi:type II secretory pathway predicted ATPase ExeA